MNFAEYPYNTEGVRLPYVVCGIGTMERQNHIIREQGMCVYQLMFTASGCGTVRCRGNEYELPVGTAVILPRDVPHEYFPNDDAPWVNNWVIFGGDGIDSVMEYYGLDGSAPVKLNSLSMIDDIFRRCSAVLRTKDKLCIHRVSPLLCEMINEVYFSASGEDRENEDSKDVLSPVIDYIDKNYSSDITLEELARLAGVGREYFCTIFRRKTGMRPFEYIAAIRIREAKKLLTYTDFTAAEIGKTVGYEDKSYFGRVFKRYAGMPPTAFRGY